MHPRKKKSTNEVFHLVATICCQLMEEEHESIQRVLNMSEEDAQDLISKVVFALPDRYFYNENPAMLDDMLLFISKNIVLFQAEENTDDANYGMHLIDFISRLTHDLEARTF